MKVLFPAKLLLFGEHTVLKGSKALAIPFPTFSGQWRFSNDPEEYPSLQLQLPNLLSYLKELKQKKVLRSLLNLEQFEEDLNRGLFFESNIPNGYGLGSSGALCAALYQRYLTSPLTDNLIELKKDLAQIESFFHGSSSGVDPLIISVNRPILIDSQKGINTISLPKAENPEVAQYQFFLLDTGISRKTAPFVNLFLKKCEDQDYLLKIQSEISVYSDEAIKGILTGDENLVYHNFHKIGQFQWEHFKEMIPEAFFKIWQESVDSDNFKIKLCGAGGGGFLLGMMKKNNGVLNYLKDQYTIIPIEI